MKIARFSDMTVTIPIEDGETEEEVEDKLIEALDAIGVGFMAYHLSVEEEEE